jgi:hypothetical protein
MPRKNSPRTLRKMAMRKVADILGENFETWLEKLFIGGEAGTVDFVQHTECVMNKCDLVHDLLTSLPINISEDLTPLLSRKIITVISHYDKRSCCLLNFAPLYAEGKHNAACTKMFRSVSLPCTRTYNTFGVSSSFVQKIIILTLESACNLMSLHLDIETNFDNSALLADNIHHLKKLLSFQYPYHCTDEVVQQLTLHCSEIRYIDIMNSPSVTDVSVQYLLELKELKFV